MVITDLKYLTAYSIPAGSLIGLNYLGVWGFLTPVYAFILVPLIEIFLQGNEQNLSEKEEKLKANNSFFDGLLYLNIPLVFGILYWFLTNLSLGVYSTSEIVGLTFSVGLVLGSNGINVAHELGHRKNQWEKTLGKLLLIPALYMHFYIEHNFGHHSNAATKEDPATAKYNQTVFSFWVTSVSKQYVSAWKIQLELLKINERSFFSIKNDMLWFIVFQSIYLLGVYFFLGFTGLFIAFAIALIGILLLETINYVEHYGLLREKTKNGRYKRMGKIHSWNSNHVMGRVMLYELTRHSDHHYRSHKKYQLLNCHESSPQMPFGYPTSIVISLIPPLWFSIMNKRIPVEMRP